MARPSYSQRALMCINLSQVLRNENRFPAGPEGLLQRGADFIEGLERVDAFIGHKAPPTFEITSLDDYNQMSEYLTLEQQAELMPKLAAWKFSLRAGTVPEPIAGEIAQFFNVAGAHYHGKVVSGMYRGFSGMAQPHYD